MVGTIAIHGGNGEVMAPCGTPGTFIPGKRFNIQILAISQDEDIPLSVREALMGMVIGCIFTHDQLSFIPQGTVAAYASEVIEALRQNGKESAALALQEVCSNELDMCGFEAGIYELVGS